MQSSDILCQGDFGCKMFSNGICFMDFVCIVVFSLNEGGGADGTAIGLDKWLAHKYTYISYSSGLVNKLQTVWLAFTL